VLDKLYSLIPHFRRRKGLFFLNVVVHPRFEEVQSASSSFFFLHDGHPPQYVVASFLNSRCGATFPFLGGSLLRLS